MRGVTEPSGIMGVVRSAQTFAVLALALATVLASRLPVILLCRWVLEVAYALVGWLLLRLPLLLLSSDGVEQPPVRALEPLDHLLGVASRRCRLQVLHDFEDVLGRVVLTDHPHAAQGTVHVEDVPPLGRKLV